MKKSQDFRIQLLLLLIFFLMGICVDLYVPSLPAITHYFKTSQQQVQLTISIYMLGYALGQLCLSTLSDSLGRKKVMLPSCLLFVLASIAAANSTGVHMLQVCRLLQGISIGGLGGSARAIATDCYSGLDLIKASTTMVISFAMGPIIGPCIGGYLQHFLFWQADFYLFAIFGLFLFLYMLVLLPETNTHIRPLQVREITGNIRTIVTYPAFIAGAIPISLVYGSIVLFNVVGPYLIQNVLQYSVVAYGHIALLMGFGYFLGNLSNRFLLRRIKPDKITYMGISGALSMACAMLILSFMIKINLFIIVIPAMLLFFCCGHVFPNLMGGMLSFFPKMGGTASAVIGSFMAAGVFLLTGLATTLETSSQEPLAIMYIVVMTVVLALFTIARKRFAL